MGGGEMPAVGAGGVILHTGGDIAVKPKLKGVSGKFSEYSVAPEEGTIVITEAEERLSAKGRR